MVVDSQMPEENRITPAQRTLAKVPAVILIGVLAYFALKK